MNFKVTSKQPRISLQSSEWNQSAHLETVAELLVAEKILA